MPENTHDLPNQSLPTANSAPNDTGRVDESQRDTPGGSKDKTPPDAPAGYELLDEIGHGGMGIVFRARDLSLGRDVAIKILQSKYTTTSLAARRFVEEAHITGQLQHPGIPPIHAVGTLADGRPFLAMKLIKGRTLAKILADGSMNRGSLIATFEQVCQAVAYAHNHGVIHRDLKPANVMVGAFGEVQVMDWGLAKFRTDARADSTEASIASTFHDPRDDFDEDLRTRTGSFLGTPAYMSPEQAIGAIDQIDERSDVFGLGAILCVILTGQPPFVGDTAESTRQLAAQKKLDDAYARLDAIAAEPELVALCKRCLAGERDSRPHDANEVAAAVHAFRIESEARARQAELDRVRAEGERVKAEVQAAEQRKRRKVQLALAGTLGLLLLVGGAFAWWADRQEADRKVEQTRAENQRQAEELLQRLEEEKRTQADRERLARNGSAVEAGLARAETALQVGDAHTAALALSEVGKRQPEGGGERFVARIEQGRADLAMLEELNGIDNFIWSLERRNVLILDLSVIRKWAKAFEGYGIVPGTTPPAESARRVANSQIRDRLLAALDLWLMAAPSQRMVDLLKHIDADAYRDAVRAAVREGDEAKVQKLGAQPASLQQPARFAVALTYYRYIPIERRRAILEKAVVNWPGDLNVLMSLGLSYQTTPGASVAEQTRCFQAAVAAHPRNSVARNYLARALSEKGDLDGAIAVYVEAIRIEPNNSRALASLGRALRNKGDLDRAITAFEKAVKIDSNNPFELGSVFTDFGDTLAEKGELDKAITVYKEAIHLDPSNILAHGGLGKTLMAKGDLDGAIAAFKEVLKISPSLGPVHHSLGLAFVAKGDLDEAIAAFKKAIRGWEAHKLNPPSECKRDLERALNLKSERDANEGRIAPPPREAKR